MYTKTITDKQEMANTLAILALTGTAFKPEHVAKAARLESEFTDVSDPGEDWSRFRLLDDEGGCLAELLVPGY